MNDKRKHGHYKGKHFVEQPSKGKGSYDRKKVNVRHSNGNQFNDTS